jgi:hypothetical protein
MNFFLLKNGNLNEQHKVMKSLIICRQKKAPEDPGLSIILKIGGKSSFQNTVYFCTIFRCVSAPIFLLGHRVKRALEDFLMIG